MLDLLIGECLLGRDRIVLGIDGQERNADAEKGIGGGSVSIIRALGGVIPDGTLDSSVYIVLALG